MYNCLDLMFYNGQLYILIIFIGIHEFPINEVLSKCPYNVQYNYTYMCNILTSGEVPVQID